MNIVLIDDEITYHSTLSLCSLVNGYNLMAFLSPKEGLQYIFANSENIDIILLDLMMPEIDGIEVLKRLKNNNSTANIPVIIQTGIANPNATNQCMALGAKACITKPYFPKIITEAIQNIKIN
ncbi:MAG: response regulator [Sphingobacteriia bacterium]|nr:response regulator [Sphingobacteriia bacterium]